MSDALTLVLTTPTKKTVYENVTKLLIPGQAGPVEILPHHATMVIGLAHGTIHIMPQNKSIAIGHGFLKVEKNSCTLSVFLPEKNTHKDLHLPNVDPLFKESLNAVLGKQSS